MAKSTAAKALASMSHKFQAKIREVGQLKKQISEGNNANVEIQRLRLRTESDAVAFDRLTNTLRLTELRAIQAEQAYKRLGTFADEQEGHAIALRSDVSNWKPMAAVLFVVGAAVGVLSALAYVAQTSPL